MNIKKLLTDRDERNLLINIALAFAFKGLAMLLSVFSMPLYMKYFDNDSILGLWYTILSTLTWIQLFDLGLGNGLRNRLTEALAIGDKQKAKEYISSTYVSLVLLALPVILVVGIVIRFADLNAFFNISEELVSPTVLCTAVEILFFGVMAHFVIKTVTAVVYAVQKPFINNIVTIAISGLPLVYLALVNGGDSQRNLLTLTVVHVLASNVPPLILTWILFRTKELRECAPSFKACKMITAKQMLNFGLQFFFAQISFMFLNSTNEIIITRLYSAASVVDYSIYYRLFTIVGSLFMLALTPLWSKVTKDLAQKKYHKIRTTNRVLYAFSGLAAVTQFLMIPVLQFGINLWLGAKAITVHYPTAFVFAFYGSAYIFNVVLTTVANGIGDLKTQMWFYGVFAALKIPVIYLLSSHTEHWNIVLLYNGVALLAFCVFQLFWVERRIAGLTKQAQSETSLAAENSIQ